jgi:TRAP-type C4-dicarboxylate transport system permease small subunit
MNSISNKLEAMLEWACAALMALMVVDVSWQVISRFILSSPSSFSEELARFLLIWIGFLGAAYAYRKGAHLGLDIVTSKLQGARKRIARAFIELMVLGFVGSVMIYGGSKIVFLTYDLKQLSAALQIPMAFVYLIIPVSGILIAFFAIQELVSPREEESDDELLEDAA